MKFDVYCWPGEGFTYPLGIGRRLRIAEPVGSKLLFGTIFPWKGAPVAGFKMGMTCPAALRVLEKSPLRSAAVGRFAVMVLVGCAICVNSWEMKKNNLRRSLFHRCGMYAGPPRL